MIGKKIHHYQITEKLGEGGMGVVYKAEDTNLHRTVALKFLNQELVDDPAEQERLVNEARSAAALSHPNICTIFEINEHEGRTFIAMEYVEGATLRDRVLSGKVELADALRYVIQIADGLEQTHEQGIIHRDIKSANIMINRAGQAVIMDFGLARRTGTVRTDERLSSGGTSAYMSPEQARGEGVDERTDIWSIGIVLYETLAGQLPFRGDYEQAVIYSILNENPRPVRELRPDVPDEVVAIVDRCLEKDPGDRFQTLQELVVMLRGALDSATDGRRVASGAKFLGGRRSRGLIAVPALVLVGLIAMFLAYDFLNVKDAGSEVHVPIAVADIRNDTGDPALDGLSGMLITALTQSSHLDVMSRTGMFDVLKTIGRENVREIDESIGQEICLEAGIEALVIPTIRKFGDLYSIDLKVLDTRNNRYILTRKEEGPGQESIPGMIDALAKNIRIDLEEPPEAVEQITPVADVTTVYLDAYEAYFNGEEFLNHLDMKAASKEFERAVEIDSTFALAHFRIAYLAWWSQQARDAAKKHVAIAMEEIDRMPVREQYLVRALNAGINEGFDEQEPFLVAMREEFPDDKEMLFGIGDARFHTEEYDSAAVYFERVIEIDPSYERALQHLTWTYQRLDRYPEARQVAEQWVAKSGSDEARASLGTALYRTGERDRAMEILLGAGERDPENIQTQIQIAEIYLAEGQTDSTLKVLYRMMAPEAPDMMRFTGSRVVGTSVLPYQGRFNDALAIFSDGIEQYGSSEEADSAVVAQMYFAKAFLYYWGWQDKEKVLETVKMTEGFAEEYRKYGYYDQLAAAYVLVGDTSTAYTLVRDNCKDDPKRDISLKLLELAMTGRCDEANLLLESELEILAKGGGVDAQTYFLIGACQVEQGDYAAAARNLEKIQDMPIEWETAPVLAPAYYMLGRAYEGMGRLGDAARAYEKVLDLWRDGDKDIPLRTDTEARYAALRAKGSM